MIEDPQVAPTLRQLLVKLRAGFMLHRPILIEVEAGVRITPDTTMPLTLEVEELPDWSEQYGREYADHPFFVMGPNTLSSGLEQPVTIGRSRRCDVRIDNDSVSKVHASVIFDRSSGEYFFTDENSRNGTCISGESISPGVPSAVWSGAYVSFGEAVFVFVDPSSLRKLSKIPL